jgi:hypothetical protein
MIYLTGPEPRSSTSGMQTAIDVLMWGWFIFLGGLMALMVLDAIRRTCRWVSAHLERDASERIAAAHGSRPAPSSPDAGPPGPARET